MSDNTKQAGFTLVELIVAVGVMGLIAVTFLAVVSNYMVVIHRNNLLTEMTVASQNLLRSTVENIRLGNGVRQSSILPDPNAPGGGWNTNNTAFVIVLTVPAVDASKNYIIDPNTGSPYMNELVYYRNGSTMMARRIANPSAVGNRMKTTCPPASANASCPPDITLAEYVKTMTFVLYNQDAVVTIDPLVARSVNITLSMQRSGPSKPITVTNSIRATLRNRF